MVNSDPERASLGFSFDDISCGGGYIIYSNEVPYDATNIIASDYMEDEIHSFKLSKHNKCR